jgi:hypothetical protein
VKPRSMDDLPDVEHTFAFRVALADVLVPEPQQPSNCTASCLYHGSPHVICMRISL